MVRRRGLEPLRITPPDPKSGASAIPPPPLSAQYFITQIALVVHFASVSYAEYKHNKNIIMQLAYYAVIPCPVTPLTSSWPAKSLSSLSWVIKSGQFIKVFFYLSSYRLIKFFKSISRIFLELNTPSHEVLISPCPMNRLRFCQSSQPQR